MAVAYVSANAQSCSVLGNTVTVSLNGVVGQLVVIGIAANCTGTLTTPSGWTRVSTTLGAAGSAPVDVIYRIADTATSVALTYSAAPSVPTATVNYFSGIDSSAPVPHVTASASATAPAITATSHETFDLTIAGAATGALSTIAQPTGYTFVSQNGAGGPYIGSAYKTQTAGSTGTAAWAITGGGNYFAYLLTISSPNSAPSAPVVTSPNGGETLDASTTITWTASSDPDGDTLVYDIDYSANNGGAWTNIATGVSGTSQAWTTSGLASGSSYLVRVRARDPLGLASAYDQSNAVFAISHNVAPNAPTSLSPAGSTTVDRTAIQRLSWAISDPNAGDTQSKFDLQWRLGTGAWNPVTSTTTQQFYDAPASTFPAGTIEWQVRTYDALGLVGPYSASAFFVAAAPPATPTITTPVNGSTVGTATGSVVWSAPSQDAYQVRKLADAAGSPDTATVYYDSGIVVSTTARDAPLSYPTNNRYEHLQVRVRVAGLWSAWASVRVLIAYTPPAAPLLTTQALPASAAISVTLANPPANLMLTDAAASFEDGTTGGWTAAYNATVANSAAAAAHGTKSLAITASAAGDGAAWTPPGVRAPVTAGQVYTGSVAVRPAATARVVGLELLWYDTGGSIVSTQPLATVNETLGAFVPVAVTATAPVGAVSVALRVTPRSMALGEVHYVDNAQVEQASAASAFHLPSAPAAASNDLYVRTAASSLLPDAARPLAGVRIGTGLAGNAVVTDRAAAIGVTYEYLARAVGTTGTTADSAWTA